MEITYLFNSGFKIEIGEIILLFDVISEEKIDFINKKVYYLASHSHWDHFSENIFKNHNEHTTYILSEDIKVGSNQENIIYMKEYEEFEDEYIKINTFSSTDKGVSFLIKAYDKNIFHSGDLNWWHWENNTESEKLQEEKDYKEKIIKLKDYLEDKPLDIAFVPFDPRLGEAMDYATKYFLETIKVKHLFPMHFMENYSYTLKLCPIIKKYKDINIYKINNKLDKFIIK